MTPEIARALGKRAKKIVFPPSPRLPVETTLDGTQIFEAELSPADIWYEHLHDWATQYAGSEMQDWSAEMLNLHFTQLYGHHSAIREFNEVNAMFYGDGHAMPMLSFIDEFARRISRRGACYDARVLALIERNNAELFRWFRAKGIRFLTCGEGFIPL
jgi:hypothetical protein